MMSRIVNNLGYVIILGGMVMLVGCQVQTPKTPQPPKAVDKPIPPPKTSTPDGVKITPYDRPEIKREQFPVVIPTPQSSPTPKFEDGQNIPAFKQLMLQAQTAFQKGQWDEAERYTMNAQRLAPQSADVFSNLARIANQKKQYANAESLARRGLSYAQNNTQKKLFWNIILQSAQQLKNQQTVAEALRQLQRL